MYSVVQKVSKSLLRRYTLPKFLTCTARTFGKVFHFTSKTTTPPTAPTIPTPPIVPTAPTIPITPTAPTIPITPTAPTNRLSGLSPFGVVGNCRVSESGALVIRLSSLVSRPSSLGDFQSSSENSIDYTIFNNFFRLVPLRGFGGLLIIIKC